VVFKETDGNQTKGFSLAQLKLAPEDQEDLQRYLDVTRAEILFSRGVVFVEGDAEAAPAPVFATSEGIDLDDIGIAVCNVGGTNFGPYLRLAVELGLRFSVITDWDPVEGGKRALGWDRTLRLLEDLRALGAASTMNAKERKKLESDEDALREAAAANGIFLNQATLELDVASTPSLRAPLISVLEKAEFGPVRRARLASWKEGKTNVNGEALMAMVADVGKGRLAARLAAAAKGLKPPSYIVDALKHVAHG
jgi:putative ATP-dependent endonuclease of OLD family